MDRGAKEFQSLTADVERTKVTVVVDDHSTESGQIRVRRDGKMRIDLNSPDQRTILRINDKLYIYNPKIRRVEEYDLGQHRALLDQFILLGFGTTADNLRKSYLVSVDGEEALGSQKTVRLQLIPKDNDVREEISRIDLWLDQATWIPAQQKFYETGSGRLLHRPLYERDPQRSHPRLTLPAELAGGCDASQTPGLRLATEVSRTDLLDLLTGPRFGGLEPLELALDQPRRHAEAQIPGAAFEHQRFPTPMPGETPSPVMRTASPRRTPRATSAHKAASTSFPRRRRSPKS